MKPKAHKRTRDPKAIGTRLRLMRQALGLTQERFVERIGMTQGAYAQYEGGHRKPSVLLACAIVDAYEEETGVDLDFIYSGDMGAIRLGFAEKMFPRKVE